ncbi:MAG: hypothetical protein Q7J23_07240 [Nitrosomonas sp.]|uniref:hypothetical protein n=1 Tax=Nitrosomonas sp. TaxID=42353 RepID=UPI00271742CF|nr:hypothetical protein [Nitrosomonas sp.]MDO9470500.1 hypothetical protein [Nitrosomonas sp.]MDP1786000.1 hypothetical protein [Nitrosomonas sp.]MDP2225612.1 hypothetical protein [Nitrosomonas sp.]
MKLSIFAATLAIFLAACSGADMGDPNASVDDCKFGVGGNGECLKEGQDPRPYGGTSKPGH